MLFYIEALIWIIIFLCAISSITSVLKKILKELQNLNDKIGKGDIK